MNNKNNTNLKDFSKKIDIKNGFLDYENSIELYKQYLSTPRPDWQNEIRRPVKPNVFKAMCATHAKIGQNPNKLIEEVLNEGGKLLFWSDLHINHTNIIKYASRPFETVDHMNQVMLGNYWNAVTDKDVVVFGGDVAFGDLEVAKELLRNLPGKKVLVLGNHDFDKNQCIFRDYKIFDITTMAFSFQKKIEDLNFNVLVTHYPIAPDALPINTINIHGHIHQHLPNEKNINMSVEHTNFSPIVMDELIMSVVQKNNFSKEKKIKNAR